MVEYISLPSGFELSWVKLALSNRVKCQWWVSQIWSCTIRGQWVSACCLEPHPSQWEQHFLSKPRVQKGWETHGTEPSYLSLQMYSKKQRCQEPQSEEEPSSQAQPESATSCQPAVVNVLCLFKKTFQCQVAYFHIIIYILSWILPQIKLRHVVQLPWSNEMFQKLWVAWK